MLDDEIPLLEVVDPIVGAQPALQIEGDAIGRAAFQRVAAFVEAGDDPRAVDAQLPALMCKAELHRVPVKPRKAMDRAKVQRLKAHLADRLHEIRPFGNGEQRYMA